MESASVEAQSSSEDQGAISRSPAERETAVSIQGHASDNFAGKPTVSFNSIVRSIPQKFFIKDRALKYAVVNDRLAADLGIPSDEIIGKTDSEFFPEDLVKEHHLVDQQVLSGGHVIEFERCSDDEHKDRWEKTIKAPLIDDSGAIVGVLGMYHDVTPQKLAELAVQQSEKDFRSLISSIRDAIVFTNVEGEIIDCNPAFSQLFGYTPEEILGNQVVHLYPSQESYDEIARQVEERPQDEHFPHTMTYRKKSGETFSGETNLFQLRDENGVPITYAALIRDITEQELARAQEARFQQAEQKRAADVATEVALASRIQYTLMKPPTITLKDIDVSASWIPASEMSGDFYNVEQIDDHRLSLWVGDVSAKGVPAGLLMVLINTYLHAELFGNMVPGNVLSKTNMHVSDLLSEAEQFATLFLGVLDTRSGLLTYSDAGHGHAFIYRKATEKFEHLEATIPPLGVKSQLVAVQQEIGLNPGDSLVVYSDGLIEAASPDGDRFGKTRLLEVVREMGSRPPQELHDAILSAVAEFNQESTLEDDLTLIVARRAADQASKLIKESLHASGTPLREWAQVQTSHTGILVPLHEWVARICAEVGPRAEQDPFLNACQLGISELVTNVIKHAYRGEHGRINIQAFEFDDRLEFLITDQGLPYETSSLEGERLPELREGSFGLMIIRQVMNEVVYTRTPENENVWRLVKRFGNVDDAGRGMKIEEIPPR